MHTLTEAALINLGNSPLIGLVLLVIGVGIAVFFLLWLLGLLKDYIKEPFMQIAVFLIYAIAIFIVVQRALLVIFGISIGGG